jgi:hypothetical protein
VFIFSRPIYTPSEVIEHTLYPLLLSICDIKRATVVLPKEPVIPIIGTLLVFLEENLEIIEFIRVKAMGNA